MVGEILHYKSSSEISHESTQFCTQRIYLKLFPSMINAVEVKKSALLQPATGQPSRLVNTWVVLFSHNFVSYFKLQEKCPIVHFVVVRHVEARITWRFTNLQIIYLSWGQNWLFHKYVKWFRGYNLHFNMQYILPFSTPLYILNKILVLIYFIAAIGEKHNSATENCTRLYYAKYCSHAFSK